MDGGPSKTKSSPQPCTFGELTDSPKSLSSPFTSESFHMGYYTAKHWEAMKTVLEGTCCTRANRGIISITVLTALHQAKGRVCGLKSLFS